ncbi:hypothetical protein SKAU_G00411280 [Synaphobranchus kaupii]|uniref:Uncharacterized protein n=1 Tax=Synaphobranchus kaupii TaxID=118154 RepID=A0A9Q1IBQ7_SYNKA|nr:hypothetical protein SKAU_G00411280 [Synaphobranchus kaupii]
MKSGLGSPSSFQGKQDKNLKGDLGKSNALFLEKVAQLLLLPTTLPQEAGNLHLRQSPAFPHWNTMMAVWGTDSVLPSVQAPALQFLKQPSKSRLHHRTALRQGSILGNGGVGETVTSLQQCSVIHQ